MEPAAVALLSDLDSLPADTLQQWQWRLPSGGRDRCRAFRSRRRYRHYISGRRLLSALLASRLGIDAEVTEHPSGQPCIRGSDIHCSIAHSGDSLMVGYSLLAPLGVDLEVHKPRRFDRLVNGFFSTAETTEFATIAPEEQESWFYRTWTRKEAFAKADGRGLTLATLKQALTSDFEGTVATLGLTGMTASLVHWRRHMPTLLEATYLAREDHFQFSPSRWRISAVNPSGFPAGDGAS